MLFKFNDQGLDLGCDHIIVHKVTGLCLVLKDCDHSTVLKGCDLFVAFHGYSLGIVPKVSGHGIDHKALV